MKTLLISLVALSLSPTMLTAGETGGPSDLQIEKVAVGTAVDNKELSGTATAFEASITRVYCWTKVLAATPPSKIQHVWYADNKKEAEVPLDIKYAATRTWSSKNVWPGQWKVDVTDAAGTVLSSTEFTVK